MRIRTLLALLLLPALLLGTAATTATAAEPGIRNTKEYQALKSYVSQLNAKKNQPQTQAEIAKYRRELSAKKTKADNKVRSLYQDRIAKAKDQRAKSRVKVRKLRAQWKSEVAELKQGLKNKLNSLESQRRSEIARINTQFDGKLNSLQNKRAKLQKRLAKAKDPVVRANLREEISSINDEIATLNSEKQSDLRAVQTKYNNLEEQAREQAASNISRTRARGERAVQEAEAALREVFAEKRAAANSIKAAEFTVVRTEYDRGVTYINEMPVTGGDND